MGYTVVTQDESHFKDACNVCSDIGSVESRGIRQMIGYQRTLGPNPSGKTVAYNDEMRIFMLWSGGFHRFSMIRSMARRQTVFITVRLSIPPPLGDYPVWTRCREVGKMVLILDKAPIVAHIPGGRK